MFPNNPTIADEDGDGLGDNQSGTDADPFLFDADNDIILTMLMYFLTWQVEVTLTTRST